MDKAELFKKIEEIRNLPTLPTVISRLTKAVEDPNVNAEMISNIVKDDPAIMSRILMTVNSVFYGVSQKVSSISQAVSLLGLIAVKNIAMTTSVFSTYNMNDRSDFDREEFWKHSICVGIATNVIYDYVKDNLKTKWSKDELHLAGLVHGIGIIILEQFFHVKFMVSLLVAQKEKLPLTQAEVETFGADHCEIGAWLGRKWNLPDSVVEAIRWHYTPQSAAPEYIDLVNLCHMAKFVCLLEKLGDFGESLAPFKQSTLKDMGLSIKDIPVLVDKIKQEAEKSEVFMAIVK